MIDPDKVTRYNLTSQELEEFLVFSVLVAGKTAKTIAKVTERFLRRVGWRPNAQDRRNSPFAMLRLSRDKLEDILRECGCGCYTMKAAALSTVIWRHDLNLKTCTVEDLEQFPGIGRKTSRFFILHTRKDFQAAVLDRHILAWLRDQDYEAPKDTPKDAKEYNRLELIFLRLASSMRKSPAELDLEIWKEYSKASEIKHRTLRRSFAEEEALWAKPRRKKSTQGQGVRSGSSRHPGVARLSGTVTFHNGLRTSKVT